MKRLGAVSLLVALTCLGLDTVYLQAQHIHVGYRVSQQESRLSDLRERVRVAEVAVHRRRDPAALQARAEALGVALAAPAAGHIMRVTPREVLAVAPARTDGRLIALVR